jgi:hypothetical protein
MGCVEWSKRDPFEDGYLQEELQFYGAPTYEKDGLEMKVCEPTGPVRLDDYLNVNLRSDMPPFPALLLDGALWMSLTPMELQAQHLAIQRAGRIAGTAGLGLGHFTLRAAAMPHVEEVHVFERDPRVIECFKAVHGEREGVREKVHYHIGDARGTIKGSVPLDTLYVDIYQTLCGDEVIEDLKELRGLVKSPADYTWWGSELGLMNCFLHGLLPRCRMHRDLALYFARWMTSPLAKYSHRVLDLEYCQRLLEVARPCWVRGEVR